MNTCAWPTITGSRIPSLSSDAELAAYKIGIVPIVVVEKGHLNRSADKGIAEFGKGHRPRSSHLSSAITSGAGAVADDSADQSEERGGVRGGVDRMRSDPRW